MLTATDEVIVRPAPIGRLTIRWRMAVGAYIDSSGTHHGFTYNTATGAFTTLDVEL